MNIIITGATGYVGRNLISVLLKNKNLNLFAITRNDALLPKQVAIIKYDIELAKNIQIAKPDLVIHLASYLTSKSDIKEIEKLIDSNITFGTKLLNALENTNLKNFINVGSFSEYHYNDGVLNPTYIYSATKTAFRSILQYYSEVQKFKVVNVIPYTIYGGADSQKKIIDILFDALDSKTPVKMSDGFQCLDFIHINDVVDFFIKLILNVSEIKDKEFYLGTGKVNSIREVAHKIETISGKKVNTNWGANSARDRDTVYACAAVGKLILSLKWRPKITIEEGLKLKLKEIQI